MNHRIIIFVLTFALGLVFSFDRPGEINFLGSSVEAQQIKKARKKRKSIFERLFGGPNKARTSRKRSKRAKNKKRRNRRSGPRLTKALSVVEKSETAKTVLVVGDFFAGGLAKGLTKAFEQSPNVKIASQSSGSSGLVRIDYYDWAGNIGAIIDEVSPQIVVVMLGTNDRQLIRLNGKKLKTRTEQWETAYRSNVESLAKAIRVKNKPLIWMGLPPVRFRKMNVDFLFFNQIYKQKVEKFGGRYVDVWDGFSDAEGNFVRSGPDINGQIVRLRSGDGINITKAGRRKLAFYLERVLGKYVDGSTTLLAALPSEIDDKNLQLEPQLDPQVSGRTGIIRLGATESRKIEILAGETLLTLESQKSVTLNLGEQLAKSRRNYSIQRVDNYRWPRGAVAPVIRPGVK